MFKILKITLALTVLTQMGADERKLPAYLVKAFEKASEIQLLSLEPDSSSDQGEKKDRLTALHGYTVFDQGNLKKEDTKKLLEAVTRMVEDSDGTAALCFIPRHGVRIKHGETVTDLVICFQCLQMKVYVDNKLKGDVTISDGPQGVLNLLYDKNKVKRVAGKK